MIFYTKKSKKIKLKAKEQQIEKAKTREEKNPETFYDSCQDRMLYELRKNCMFRRIPDNQIGHLCNWNYIKGLRFGSDNVFNFNFEKKMNSKELKSCAKQLLQVFRDNRIHSHSFCVYFCNTDLQDLLESIYLLSHGKRFWFKHNF